MRQKPVLTVLIARLNVYTGDATADRPDRCSLEVLQSDFEFVKTLSYRGTG